MFPGKHLTGVVTGRRAITDELWIVRVKVEGQIAFVPGQYVTVGLPIGGKLIERPYSVASDPRDPELEFFLEVVAGGRLSPHLSEVPVGGQVFVRPAAKGRFNLDREHLNHFMVATVTGVAPFVSMVRDLAATRAQQDARSCRVLILHSAGFPAELAYREELSGLARRQTWFRYVPTISRFWLDPEWTGERGRAEDVARKYLDALEFAAPSTTAYLCGNPHMIRNMEGILQRAGFPKESIKREIYWPAD